MAGVIGQLLILIAFVATGLAGFGFYRAAQYPSDPINWKRIGRTAWGVMAACVIAAWGLLIVLIATHQFQYNYVYEHSSRDLPMYYLFSAAWEGQEGSFMLWIFLNSLVGLTLIKWAARSYEAPVMSVVAFCQLFLISMVVGLQFAGLKIGASPFATLAEKFPEAPIFQQDPNFVPADGQGLNDLLQNYWMVIHPPMLFIGFATMIVPFAFAVSALWKKRYTEWVRPALPWTLLSVMVLGIGVAMGGYWAYETLSFGGYWAWDPVENSSLVPWLVGVAGVHMMLIQRKSGIGHKGALFLCILAYMLVIYSTFLTRSGILGDVSVHSFVDLGLYNQLLLWILALGLGGFGLFAYRYKDLPKPKKEPNYLSREFMIFSGAVLLCAVAAVVILGTSSPIFGRIFRNNPASVPIDFYNRWTLPLSVGFVFLAGLGQLFWWNKMSVENVNRVLMGPVALAVVSTLAILIFTPFVEGTVVSPGAPPVAQAAGFFDMYGPGMLLLLLLFVAFFAFYGNGLVLWRIARGNPKLAGGALAHVGLALAILGVIASAGFSNPLAQPGTGRDNFVLERGTPEVVEGYTVVYTGTEPGERGQTVYVLNVTDARGRTFTMRPIAYESKNGQWIQHPDLKLYVEKDLYVAISPNLMLEGDQPKGGELTLTPGDSTVIGHQEFAVRFVAIDEEVDPALMPQRNGRTITLARGEAENVGAQNFEVRFVTFDTQVDEQQLPENTEVAVAAVLEVTNPATGETRTLRPVYIIKQDRAVAFLPDGVPAWNLTITFASMNVNTGEIDLAVEGVGGPAPIREAVAAVLDVTNLATGERRELRPVYVAREDGTVAFNQARAWNLAVAFSNKNEETGQITLAIDGVDVTPDDWILVQALEKPVISLVWIGIILLSFGFGLALIRRVEEVRVSIKRGRV